VPNSASYILHIDLHGELYLGNVEGLKLYMLAQIYTVLTSV
jgi:hypothetical protein